MPFTTNYEEKEQEVEIVNFTRSTMSGGSVIAGFSNEQLDFTLHLRNGAVSEVTAALFVQDVPAGAKTLYEKAVSDLEAKKEQEGLAALRSALETFPKYYLALEKLGTEYVRLGHFEVAEVLLKLAVDVNPRAYRSWYGLAFSQYALKSYAEAETSVAKTISLEPNSAESYLLSGVISKVNQKFEHAEKQLLKARDLAGGRLPQVHMELALLYTNNMKRYGDAARELKNYLKLTPDSKESEKLKKLIADLEAKAAGK
jgi:tetratricopeptide (TPR) repeat protein